MSPSKKPSRRSPKRDQENDAFTVVMRHMMERRRTEAQEAREALDRFEAATKDIQGALSVTEFEALLAHTDLLDRLPDLHADLADLSISNETCYGFSFDPAELCIAPRDLPRMLLGLWAGILIRPLVIDSPSRGDVNALQLSGETTMLEYRVRALAKSGLGFSDIEFSLPFWTNLRACADAPLWTALLKNDGGVDASRKHLAEVYPTLPPTPTIADRAGTAPRFLLIGPDDEPSINRVLADDIDGHPRIEVRELGGRSVRGALEQHARFLSPEAALLALGAPGVRDDYTSRLATDSWAWVSGITQDGRVAAFSTQDYGIHLGVADPTNQDPMIRFPASSE
jgi:hypothetical protein